MARRVHRVVHPVAESDLLPFVVGDPDPRARRARAEPRVVVLHAAVDEIRRPHVHADGVKLSDGEVVDLRERLALVPSLVQAAVRAKEEVVRVPRVDPHGVEVALGADVVGRRVRHAAEGPAAVDALVVGDGEDVHPLVIVWIDEDVTVVHGTRVERVHFDPRSARVFRPVHAAVGGMLDDGVQHARIRAGEGKADAALVAGGQTGGELGPSAAAVRGLVDAAPRAPAVEPPRAPQPLVSGGVQHFGIRGIHREVHDARETVHEQHLAPRLAAVRRLVHAAVGARRPQVAERGDVGDVRVRRMHPHATDVPGVLES